MREGGAGEAAAGGGREGSGPAQLLQDDGVVGRRGDHAHVLVVLGGGADHGRPADVDELDGGVRGEGIEVDDDEVDGLDPVGLEVRQVLGLRTVGEDPAVDRGVEGLDAAAQHLGRAGHLGDLGVRDARRRRAWRTCCRSRPAPSRGPRGPGRTRPALPCRRRTAAPSRANPRRTAPPSQPFPLRHVLTFTAPYPGSAPGAGSRGPPPVRRAPRPRWPGRGALDHS